MHRTEPMYRDSDWVISGLSLDLKKNTKTRGIAAEFGFDTHLLKCNFKQCSLVV